MANRKAVARPHFTQAAQRQEGLPTGAGIAGKLLEEGKRLGLHAACGGNPNEALREQVQRAWADW